MDYKKKYEEALDQANVIHKSIRNDLKQVIEQIFPELKESEDEKIRKAIIDIVKKDEERIGTNAHLKKLQWLEKQKDRTDENIINLAKDARGKHDSKQKPVEEVNGEDYGIDGLYAAMDILNKTFGQVEGYQSDDGILEHKAAMTAVKKLYKQKPEWNEEDIEMIDRLIRHCEKEHKELCNDKYGHQEIVSDLKRSCRERWDWLESLKNKVISQKQ